MTKHITQRALDGAWSPIPIIAALLVVLLAALQALAQSGNLALGRAVMRSSDITAGRATSAVDGNVATFWQPLAKGIRINNRLLETFLPNVFEYTVTLPAGTTEVPDVRPHNHRFRSRVIDAASVNGKATLILWDRNETNSVRYTIRFVTPTP